MASKTFGEFVKDRRGTLGQTLRSFCQEHGFDAGNFSRLERGLFPPPDDEAILTRYAQALQIAKGTKEWLEFFDLAAIEKGRLPKDVLANKELLPKLPILCRTIASKPLSPEKLDQLIETLRRS